MRVVRVEINPFSSGKLVGFAKVHFSFDDTKGEHMTWKNMSVFESNGRVDFATPTERGKDKEGATVYNRVVSLNRSKEGEGHNKADEFYEYVRGKIEEEFRSLSQVKQQPAQPAANTGTIAEDDDIPF